VTNGTNDAVASRRKVIHATCTKHGSARGFTNLAVSKHDGEIVFDPHVTGGCVIVLDEAAATAVRDALTEWLG
jgi:tRNA G10  N-methylase Trm11